MNLFSDLKLKTGYIAAITRGHNAGVCLLKDGEILFSIEEERLSRQKYDGGPLASIVKIKEYTDKIDYLLVAHTTPLHNTAGTIDYSGDDIYTGLARKLGLIESNVNIDNRNHPQVIDLSGIHHKLHAACAFYRSGYNDAVAVVVDGCGTFFNIQYGGDPITVFETESIIDCSYPNNLKTIFKNYGCKEPIVASYYDELDSRNIIEEGTHQAWVTDRAGIVKVYEAVTQYCNFSAIEAGKTMGLFPYGNENPKIPKLFESNSIVPISNRNLICPLYPMAASVNANLFEYLQDNIEGDVTTLQNRRDLAYACQIETQDQVTKFIKHAVLLTGRKNVVISGGYGLNCVANYHYLESLGDENIDIYVEPVSNDAGTAMGAALLFWNEVNQSESYPKAETLYYGPKYNYSIQDVEDRLKNTNAEIFDADYKKVIQLIREKNIVSIFQGKSENGPRALGNRSILFDPTFEDGKDFVNTVKNREYFRPFAGTILEEHVHEWFDLRGMENSPFMMYAVNCKEGTAEKIPSIIHTDGTCRIQTVTAEQNLHFYNLIKEFYEQTNIPILFNTSFNLGGEPLVETLNDAIRTLVNSNIEYLYLPELSKLIFIKNTV